MKESSLIINVSKTIGSISAKIIEPPVMNCMITLAHGAGAGMQHPFMTALAQQLAMLSIGTIRFNFPYMEQKRKRPDVPAIAHKTIEAVLHRTHELYPTTTIVASGKSFGGRMTSQFIAKGEISFLKGIIFFGFPLHPVGNSGVERAEHLQQVKVPMLFLQGTRDALADIALIQKVCDALPTATLIPINGADHSFKKGKENHIDILALSSQRWIASIL